MVRSQSLFLDRQGALIELLSLCVVALGIRERGEVIESDGDLIVLWTERAFEDDQCPSVEGLRLVVPALPVEDGRQGGHIRSDCRMVRTQGPLANGHGLPCQGFTAGIAASGIL